MFEDDESSEIRPSQDLSIRGRPSHVAAPRSSSINWARRSRALSQLSQKQRKLLLDTIKHHRLPVKPLADLNTYHVIELGNGLKATLVTHHLETPLEAASINHNDDDGEHDSAELFYMDHLSIGSDDSDEEARLEDLSLPKMSPSGTQHMAACSLTVAVGSFSDPPEIPGLAHFLEHMMMRGSLKYPRPMEFDFFIHKVGGHFNSFTECEHTTYYFDCPLKHMRRALDIFAHCFIHPLLKIDYIAKAREEIELETEYDKTVDKYRMQRILCASANRNNPAHLFSISSPQFDQISDDLLHRSLHAFRNNHYSSDQMFLAIQAPIESALLQRWVVDCFLLVPRWPTDTANKFPILREPFQRDKFYSMVYVSSELETTRLVVTWALPPVVCMRKTKPLKYISYLFNYTGVNSLLNHLKEENLATQLVVEGQSDGIMTNKLYSLFSVTIKLTELGSTEYPSVLGALFCFVESIKSDGLSERLLSDFQALRQNDFNYSDNLPPLKNVEIISENMILRSSREYLTDGDLSSSYRGDKIVRFLNLMTPNRANIMIIAHSLDKGNVLNQQETSLNTRYLIQNVPQPWMDVWMNLEPSTQFTFPTINQYIPTEFSQISCKTALIPNLIKSSELLELWYKPDIQFTKPAASVNFQIITYKVFRSVHDVTHLSAFLCALNVILVNSLYPALLAQYEYEFTLVDFGLEIQVYGFSQHIGKVVQTIAEEIKNLSDSLTEKLVETAKTQMAESLLKRLRSVSTAARDIRKSILIEKHVSCIDQLNAIHLITLSSLSQYSENIFSDVFVQALVQGNVKEDEAINICDQFIRKTKCTPLPKNRLPFSRVTRLPPQSEKCICVKSFNKNSKKSIASFYFQLGPNNIKEAVSIRFALMLMEEAIFAKLRMEEKLGHDVSYTVEDTQGVLGFTINIHTNTRKLNEHDLCQRLNFFSSRIVEGMIALPQNDFYDAQLELAQLINAKPSSLKEDVRRNWKEITRTEYNFGRSDAEIAALYAETIQTLHMFLQKYIVKNRLGHRKLVVMIDGYDKPHEEERSFEKSPSVSLVSTFKNEPLSLDHFRIPKALSLDDHCYIEDLAAFKQKADKFEKRKKIQEWH